MEVLREFFSTHARKIALILTSVSVLYLVVPPIVVLLFSAVRNTQDRLPFEATNFTIGNFKQVFSSPVFYELLLNTLWYAAGSVFIGLTLAATFAWFLERTDVPFRRLLFVLTLAPMGIPGIVQGMAWILLANPTNGLFNVILRSLLGLEGKGPLNIYSIPGMIIVTSIRYVPIIYIMISGVFSKIDPVFEEAGSTSGGNRWSIFRRISLPLLTPAILAAIIYFLVMSIEVFETAALLGFPQRIFLFSTMIYYAAHPPQGLPNYGIAATYGIVLLITATVLIYFYRRHVRHAERFATVTGRGYRPRLIDLGVWRYVPAILMFGYFVLTVLFPFFVLLWKSLAPQFAKLSFSTLPLLGLDAYKTMLDYPYLWVALKNTVIIGVVTASVVMILVTLISWFSVRMRGLSGSYLEYLSFIILGVPGVVLALSLMFIYASLPIPVYGTIWVIVIGLVTLSLPFGTRLMNAGLLQIHRELEEASATSGAGSITTLSRIILPLLWPTFARGFLWVFVRCMCDATMTLMLSAANNRTLAVTLWYIWTEDGDFPLACAISVPLVIFSSLLAFLVARQTILMEGAT